MQTSECVVEVSDAWIRPILTANRIKGKRATITYGFAGIAESDFLALACGPIGEISFEGSRDSGTVSISVMDLMTTFRDQTVYASWINKHPLQILYDGSVADPMTGTTGGRSLLSMCGYDSDTWVTESTFNPTDAAYTGSISHWCVSRVSPFDVYQPTSAADLINDLCRLLMGSILSDETGKLSFKRWDPAAVAVDTFTVDDILPGTFRQEPLDANVANRVVIKLAADSDNVGLNYPERTFEINDSDSQTAYAYPDQTSRAISNEFQSSFSPPLHAELFEDITAGATSLSAFGQMHGWCGMRELCIENVPDTDVPVDEVAALAAAQSASVKISTDRPSYLLLDNIYSIGSEAEVVKVTAGGYVSALNLGFPWQVQAYNDFTLGGWRNAIFIADYTATTMVRAQLGTTAIAHKRNGLTGTFGNLQHTQLWDITCLVDSATKTLNRFKYGCPIVEFETPCNKMAIQQGDSVSLVLPDFLAYGFDGVTSSTTWEVVGKEVDPMASPPRIKWRLAVNTTTPVTNGLSRYSGGVDFNIEAQRRGSQEADEQQLGFVAYGFTVTVVSGLQVSIAAGAAASTGTRAGTTAARVVTLPASKDNYIGYNTYTKTFGFVSVANGAATPSKGASDIWIAKCVTNATDVTSIVDLRETLPYNFDKVKDGSTWRKVKSVNSSNECVEASITDGAVTEGKVGALAITSGKIASNAVVAAKVADGAIAGVHVAAGDKRRFANANADFQQWTRG
jgi:hypothetical protein